MNELRIFRSEEFGEVRTAIIDGKIYFAGRDVALALGYKDTVSALKSHCRGVVKHHLTDTLGRSQEASFISEGDLYRLIIKSQLPSAEKFESWVFDKVLPEIRKTGSYVKRPDSYMIEDPVERAQRWIEEQKEKKALEEKNRQLAPRAELFDKLLDSSHLVNFRDAAKEIGISQSQFTGWLKENEYVYANSAGELRPMERYMSSGLFQMKPYQNPYNGYCGNRTYLTANGLATFKMLLDTSDMNRENMPKHGGRNRRRRTLEVAADK